MSSRFHLPVNRRVPLPLTAADLARLESLKRTPGSRRALGALSGEPVDTESTSPSEAALLHALVEAGWRALERGLEDDGYAESAVESETTTAGQRDEARRRQPAWADEH